MHVRLVLHSIGKIILNLGLTMFFPLLVALIDHGVDLPAFCGAIIMTLLVGGGLTLIKPVGDFRRREGFAVVGVGWVLIVFLGALPFFLSGIVATYTDAFFETMSGFTTTGATILPAVEGVPRGILLWRSLIHWLGGMGIIVLSLALFSFRQGASLFEAEVPGLVPERIVPRLKNTAMTLWLIYTVLTLVAAIALHLAGLSLFESVIHAFGTLATGGFSSRNISIEAFQSLPIEIIITLFTFLAGINFSLYYRVVKKRSFKPLLHNTEIRVFAGIIILASLLIAVALVTEMALPVGEALRRAVFQVVNIITTTGFSSDNFAAWPTFAQGILFILMFFGGCAGSTAGGIKIARLIVLFKYATRLVQKTIHPRQVFQTKVEHSPLPDTVLHEILAFFFIYIALFAFGGLFLMATGEEMVTALTASAAAIGNIGPGLANVGPYSNYAAFTAPAKWMLSFLMLVGRLEILPILVLFSSHFWRK
ncbi:MAG: TrkH family potassium uptake protein [Firmicutes bacterium]|nr:TrkH family potassium uptake protein [Bacillota bacterium]